LQIIAGMFIVSCSGLTSRQKKCVLADGHTRVLEESFKIVCISRLWAGKSAVRVPAGGKSFFLEMSIPAVGPTRIQWVLGFFLEIK
jgi:hypothetical protein